MKILKNSFKVSILAISLIFSSVVSAQGNDGTFADESIQDITTVAALGGVGAVLGLSTLSFVEEPGDHLKNIVVGGAIGIIVGVAVVAYNQANKSKSFYEDNAYNQNLGPKFDSMKRYEWHTASREVKLARSSQQINFNFTF